jgi:hypothetical protein
MIGSQGPMEYSCNYLVNGETADDMLVCVPASVSTTIKGTVLILSKQMMNRVRSPETEALLETGFFYALFAAE